MVKGKEKKKPAFPLKETLCNSKQIAKLSGMGSTEGVMSCSKHDLSFSGCVNQKGEMRFNLARTVSLVRWYVGIIKCEGIEMQGLNWNTSSVVSTWMFTVADQKKRQGWKTFYGALHMNCPVYPLSSSAHIQTILAFVSKPELSFWYVPNKNLNILTLTSFVVFVSAAIQNHNICLYW